ncbi:FAD-binding oxidoreductase [Allomesorhizobium alhagi]|jgi:FAD/FMN-containing dehydrogenase|uniref:Actin interacting protein n=1 Tax=Mesorhizobium alhagi CCNWXJ12-2 TaxID=1107882 RepID=H0I1S0_9HYPH|nr:FAD-binding oxidoreductase [Mesorhizobium alhagi]EHK53060.1 actin interacting protein [Mesorhizobium alhagi CCNWXJ12-2]
MTAATRRLPMIEVLRGVLGDAGVIFDGASMARYLTDWSGDHKGRALAILRPASTAEVRDAVKICGQSGLTIVPQGGNTGLVAASMSTDADHTAVISLERMNRIRQLDAENFTIRVDAGCTLQQVKDACEVADLLFPLALGAQGSCQIGGNVATNAGGVNVLCYGMMRDIILGLEVVMPDGELWNGFSGLRKDNRGYDLKQLFIGSEGTLGIITGVELKLFPKPSKVETVYVGVASFEDAMRLFRDTRRACSDLLTAFEVIGEECVSLARLVHPELAVPIAAPVHVLMEASCSGAIDLRRLLENVLAEAMEDGLVTGAFLAESVAQARCFWAIREGLVEGQARRGYHVRTDLSVPLSGVPALIERARGIVASKYPGWTSIAYGHAGDGNVHFNVLPPQDMGEPAARAIGVSIETDLYGLVTTAGGSISAEHGIGRSRKDVFWSLLPPIHKRMLKAVKSAFDPDGLMNPGCLFPEEKELA